MMKINLIGEFPKKAKRSLFWYGLLGGLTLVFILVFGHYAVHSTPPTVISAVIAAVGDNLHVEQVIRSPRLPISRYQISLNGEEWFHKIPLTCKEYGAVIVFVKRPSNWGTEVLETMVIVQDPHGQCEGVYGP